MTSRLRLLPLLLALAAVLLTSACTGGWVPAAQLASQTAPTVETPAPSVTLTLQPSASLTPAPSLTQPSLTPSPTSTRTLPLSATASLTATSAPALSAAEQIATLEAQPIPGVTIPPGRRPTATRPPTRTPTVTNTPTVTPTPLPPYALPRVARPGRFSKVTSPVRVEIFARPGDDGIIQIDLIGEDNRFITRKALDYRNYLGRQIGIAPEVEFQIQAVAETARLVVHTNDSFGRAIALTSVELVLLTIGENEINLPVYQMQPYILREPKEDGLFADGVARIVGLARPVNDTPLIFQLIAEDGRVLAERKMQVAQPTGDLSHTPFTIDLPYSVSENTPARLTIRQESDTRIGGTVALTSRLVMLLP